jgi:hypothetical protein
VVQAAQVRLADHLGLLRRTAHGSSGIKEGRMPLLSSATVLRLVDSMAILLSQAHQLARARLASTASPILRLLVHCDQEATEADLLRREVEIPATSGL